jgi:hypothetical protein
MVVVPTENPVTTPFGLIVATEVFEETQAVGVAAVVVAVSAIESPIPTEVRPEITGNGFTVTLKLDVLPEEQLPLLTTAL